MARPGPPEWQDLIKTRLMAKQAESEVYKDLIDQYRRLARTARELKIRNRALLKSGAGSGGAEGSSPLLAHLDAQLTSLRAELSTLYRTQAASQNKQLTMADALRDRDQEVRELKEELREMRDARDAALRRDRDWEERWRMRNKDMETLNDELMSLNLELTSVSEQNSALRHDNASLLQRWIDKMNSTAEEMNEEFEKEMAEREALEGEGSLIDENDTQDVEAEKPRAADKAGTAAITGQGKAKEINQEKTPVRRTPATPTSSSRAKEREKVQTPSSSMIKGKGKAKEDFR
ncbi:hypothetical protein IAU60_000575 [Kwoniella sp. DSM 27419]